MKVYAKDYYNGVLREVEFIQKLSDTQSLVTYKNSYTVIENKDILSDEYNDKAKKLNNARVLCEKYYKKYTQTQELVKVLKEETLKS